MSADVVGGLEREVKIDVDANRLKYYNLSFNDITNIISSENVSIPGGGVNIGNANYRGFAWDCCWIRSAISSTFEG